MRSTIIEHRTTQNRPRASWCVTNTDTQTITPLRRCRLNLSPRLSARHTTRTRHDPRRAPRPRHAHRPLTAPAGQQARSRARRNIFFGSSSSRRRRWWCVCAHEQNPDFAFRTDRRRSGREWCQQTPSTAAVTWVVVAWHSHGRARSMAGQIGHSIICRRHGRTSGLSAPL